jgi:hypothetical protein
MFYTNSTVIESIHTIRRLFPDVSMREGSDLSELGWYPLKETDQPVYDESTHKLTSEPVFVNNEWVRQWNVVALSEEELAARVPSVVEMAQARLALLNEGSLDTVESNIASMGPAAQIEWEYRTTVRRDNALVAAMKAQLGWTDEQLDNLFIAAAQL